MYVASGPIITIIFDGSIVIHSLLSLSNGVNNGYKKIEIQYDNSCFDEIYCFDSDKPYNNSNYNTSNGINDNRICLFRLNKVNDKSLKEYYWISMNIMNMITISSSSFSSSINCIKYILIYNEATKEISLFLSPQEDISTENANKNQLLNVLFDKVSYYYQQVINNS